MAEEEKAHTKTAPVYTVKNSGFVTRCDEYEPNFCFNLTHSMDLPSSSNNEVEYFFEFSFHPPIITTPLPVGEVTIDAWLNLKGNLGPRNIFWVK